MSTNERDYDILTFDFSLPHSDITLARATRRKDSIVQIWWVDVMMWVNGTRMLVHARLDLGKQSFIDPIYDLDGVIDDEACEKLKLQRYAIVELIQRMMAITVSLPN